jgi:hypothetical protein
MNGTIAQMMAIRLAEASGEHAKDRTSTHLPSAIYQAATARSLPSTGRRCF